MKNSYIFFLGFILFASCSKDPRISKGEIHLAEKRLNASNSTLKGRNLAQSQTNVCANDPISEERLIQEIKLLENNKLPHSKAIINGIDLSRFSPSQAAYMENNRDWIPSEGLDYSDCSDVKCIFSKIYPDSDGYEGYLHYYFYLKMGYVISTNGFNGSEVTAQKDAKYNVSFDSKDILFSKEELRGFYYLTKALGSSFEKMPSLRSIHRVPSGRAVPGYDLPTKELGGVCGLAGGYFEKAVILLADGCLKRDTKIPFGDEFDTSVTHELAHRLDHAFLPNRKQFSTSDTWINFSNWSKKENIDSATGLTTSDWDFPGKNSNNRNLNGFVSYYAQSSPIEDFAETLANARFHTQKSLGNAQKKSEWVIKNIFGGRNYSPNGIVENYSNFLVEHSIGKLPSIISSCVENNVTYFYELNSTQINEYREYDPSLIKCIFGGLNQAITTGINELKLNEPEACGFFSKGSGLLSQKVLSYMNEFIKKDLNKNIEISIQLQTLAEFLQKLNEEIDAREIFIACQEDSNAAECFSKQISANYKTIANEYADKIPNQLTALETNYLAENSFMATKGKIITLFNLIYAGSETKFKDEAKRKWKSCYEKAIETDSSSESQPLLLYPYNGGNQYIKKSLLNCINNSAEENLLSILDRTSKKLSITITNPVTKKFILEMYLNHFTAAIQDFVASAKNKEAQQMLERKNSTSAKVISSLTTDTSWIESDIKSDAEIQRSCEIASKEKIQSALNNEKETTGSEFTFHSASDDIWQDGLCSNVLNHPKVRNIFVGNQERIIKIALPKLSQIFLDEAETTMDKCKAQFSKENIAIIKLRNVCLTNLVTWNSLEEAAMKNWLFNERLSFIPMSSKRGNDYLDSKKTELKNTAIKLMNAKKSSK